VVLVLVVVAWNAAALAIDSSSLQGSEDGWGVLFGSAVGTVIYGALPILLSLVASLVAAFGAPRMARAAAWVIAVLSALCGVGLFLVAGLTISQSPAEQAFGVVSLLLGLVVLAPAVLCVRRAGSERVGGGENQAAGRTRLA
jgi:uncharacterized membrane protein